MSSAPTRQRLRSAVALLLIGTVTAITFANARPDTLVLDDKLYVPNLTGCSVSQLFSTIPWASDGLGGPFRPLSMGTICLEAAIHGPCERCFHTTNIVLHLVATFLVYFLALGLLRDRAVDGGVASLAAAGGALVFGVHPVHAEAVNSIFNRSEILSTLCVLTGLLWLRRYEHRRPALAWTGGALAYFAGLLCKESAVSFPLLAVLFVVFGTTARPRLSLRRAMPAVTLVIPLLAYLWLRHHAIGTVTATIPAAAIVEGELTWMKRLAYLVTTIGDAVRLLLWPYPLRASYEVYQPHVFSGAVLLLFTIVLLAAIFWRRAPLLAFALAWVVIALLASTRLVTDVTVAGFAERFLYLPSVGAALGLAAILAAVARVADPIVAAVSVVLVSLTLSLVTWERNFDWRDDVTLWEHDVEVAPENGSAWMHLTSNLLGRGEHPRIAELCAKHLESTIPPSGQFFNNCALAAKALGRWDEAERLYVRAIALGEGTNVYFNLAVLLNRRGRTAEAEMIFEEAIAREASDAMRYLRRGQMIAIVHPERVADARAQLELALRASPGFQPAISWLKRLR